MKGLERLGVGPFDIKDGVSLVEFEAACRYGFFERYVHAQDTVLLQHNAAVIGYDKEDAIRKGQEVALDIKSSLVSCNILRSYSLDGRFIGIISYDSERARWQPEKVFNS
jgi:tRNA U55 pseudouridine synthase TruB